MNKYKIMAAMLGLVCVLSSCGKDYVGKVNSEKITKSEFEFYLASVKQQMEGTELTSDEDWNTKEIEGKKAIDVAKEKAFDTAVDNLSYIEVAKKLGLDFTAEERKSIDNYKDQIVKYYGGTSTYNKYLKEKGITDDFIKMMCDSLGYNDKLLEKVKQDKAVTDEEYADYFKKHFRRAKHVLIMTMDGETLTPYSEEKQAEAKVTADKVFELAKNGADFEKLIEEYNEDPGVATNPDGYVFTDGEMVQEFTDGVDSIAVGEITMVQTDYGYHIIKRYALDESDEYFKTTLESKKSVIENEVLKQRLDKQLDEWRAEFGIKIEKNDEIYNTISG